MILHFYKILTQWYLQNKRDLPWRNTSDPYKIWLSEIILQQTKVSQGLPYYNKFIAEFPKVTDLAEANEEKILKLWQGLGYYSRARNLHAASKMVIDNYGGIFPKTYNELIKLKGVGIYTASAIASFANNEVVAVLDGNVYRVLSRLFGIETPINGKQGEKEFLKLASRLINKEDPATYNQAIMEFGALACKPKKPNCMFCPFSTECVAFNTNKIADLPVKLKKTKVKKRYFNYFIIKHNKLIAIQKRENKGIWQHLYEFPLIESEKKLTETETEKAFSNLNLNYTNFKKLITLEKPHKLSHQHIYTDFYLVEVEQFQKNNFKTISLSEIDKYPVPVLISNFIESKVFKTTMFL